MSDDISLTLLIVDDDEDDLLLIKDALARNFQVKNLICLKDGEELLDYLYQRGRYKEPNIRLRPDLILLDLNMPKKHGCEVLKEIRESQQFKSIPIVVLTTSHDKDDINYSYQLGCNAFITKPSSF